MRCDARRQVVRYGEEPATDLVTGASPFGILTASPFAQCICLVDVP
jgi:hypothetical protein